MVPNQRAGTLGALTEGERKLGAVLFDIGNRVSTVTLVKGDRMLDSGTIPGGGFHLTNDLSLGLSISREIAEKVKLEFGTTTLEIGSAEVSVESNEAAPILINRVSMIELLKERSKEILGMAENYMNSSGYGDLPAGGIILTGGSSQLPGLADMIKQRFNCQVRVGSPRGAERISDNLNLPNWAPSIGGLLWSNDGMQKKLPLVIKKLISQFQTMKQYLQDNNARNNPTLPIRDSKTQGEVALTK